MVAEWGSARVYRDVSRGASQGLLWIEVGKDFLKKLEETGCSVIANADDVALMG